MSFSSGAKQLSANLALYLEVSKLIYDYVAEATDKCGVVFVTSAGESAE